MRQLMNSVPMLLLAMSLPAFAAQADAPNPGTTHRIQVFQSGKGEPRVRAAMAARTASPSTLNSAQGQAVAQGRAAVQGTGRTRPYQPAKPGEGLPKR